MLGVRSYPSVGQLRIAARVDEPQAPRIAWGGLESLAESCNFSARFRPL